jgi:mono/diheme cytochrome c family protein
MVLTVAGFASAQDAKAKGEAVFAAQKCSLCHSIAGKGNP